MEEKVIKSNINLIKRDSAYTLTIPQNVERKIRFLCNKIHDIEWSGILFFDYRGSFETNDLEIICRDIYVMDIGVSTYTEFDMNPDVISYMAQNQELLDCQSGLAHSHHVMKTYMSGTDLNTLKEEGVDRNNFVSLIVNNEGTYTAAITRKIKSKKEYISYEFFGEGEKHDIIDNNEEITIEYYYLNIIKEGETLEFNDIEERINEIKKNKTTSRIIQNNNTKFYPQHNQRNLFSDYKPIESNKTNYTEKENSYLNKEEILLNEEDIPYDTLKVDNNVLKSLLYQIITGSIIITNKSNIDLDKWLNNMSKLYSNRFGNDKEGFSSFSYWADTYTEYLTMYIEDENLRALGYDSTEIGAIYSYKLIMELEKLTPNIYIKEYISSLEKYLLL